jgi:anaerobic magnesium-protoporphyrin IX monomethyl ester cyclase
MIVGIRNSHSIDAIFINSPLKNYDLSPRYNDFTLPVLGLGYIATFVRNQGFNVGVLDAEALRLGVSEIASIINGTNPRWLGLNLLAPTYRYSVEILQKLSPEIAVMLGGHQAKAMPSQILAYSRIPRIDALILGESEYRVAAILEKTDRRSDLPEVYWRISLDDIRQGNAHSNSDRTYWLAPDINSLPFLIAFS